MPFGNDTHRLRHGHRRNNDAHLRSTADDAWASVREDVSRPLPRQQQHTAHLAVPAEDHADAAAICLVSKVNRKLERDQDGLWALGEVTQWPAHRYRIWRA